MKGVVTTIVLMLAGIVAFGQTSQSNPTSLKPNLPTKVYAPKASKKKKKSTGPTYDAREKFYDRMEENGKRRRKSEKAKLTPQYSDFQYFGHRKPPKKRPPEKMKYCKICGIRH